MDAASAISCAAMSSSGKHGVGRMPDTHRSSFNYEVGGVNRDLATFGASRLAWEILTH